MVGCSITIFNHSNGNTVSEEQDPSLAPKVQYDADRDLNVLGTQEEIIKDTLTIK